MSNAARNRLGPYELNVPLGTGGMGEVFRARDTRLNRDVAVKEAESDCRQRGAVDGVNSVAVLQCSLRPQLTDERLKGRVGFSRWAAKIRRRPAIREHERGQGRRVSKRRHQRGDHHRAVEDQRLKSLGAHVELRVQGQERRHP